MSMMDQHVESLDEILQGAEDGKNPEEIEKQIQEAEDILQEMKIELHSVTNKQKKDDYIIKMQSYQRIIAKHKKTILTTSTSSMNGTREPLSATQKNQESLEVLKKAHAQLIETEDVGIGVLSNLAKQKETIKKVKGNLDDSNQELVYSNKLVNRMGKWWRG